MAHTYLPFVRGSTLVFFSRSANLSARYLSNFTLLAQPLVITCVDFPVASLVNKEFPSVEHAFQASKIVFSGGTTKNVSCMQAGTDVDTLTPQECKTKGSRKGFLAMGLEFDARAWGSISVSVMKKLLACRAQVDERFADNVTSNRRLRKHHAHFERSGSSSFWGGSFDRHTLEWKGANMLGILLDTLASEIETEAIIF
jgi:predicted NAD-dependent protein-ADP-ribosyltransferase YbiA (DUF1768 family)